MTIADRRARTVNMNMRVARGPNRAVVVLEGDDDLRACMRDVLEDEGYVVITSASLGEWRACLAQLRDAIVLDVRFHIVDLTVAKSAFEELRDGGWRQPIIAVSPDGTLALDVLERDGRSVRFACMPPHELVDLIHELTAN